MNAHFQMTINLCVQIAPVLCSYLTITVLNHCSIAAVLFTKYWGLAGKGTKSKPAKLKVSLLTVICPEESLKERHICALDFLHIWISYTFSVFPLSYM